MPNTAIGFRHGQRLHELYDEHRDKSLSDDETDYAAAAKALRQLADEIECGGDRSNEYRSEKSVEA